MLESQTDSGSEKTSMILISQLTINRANPILGSLPSKQQPQVLENEASEEMLKTVIPWAAASVSLVLTTVLGSIANFHVHDNCAGGDIYLTADDIKA